MQATTNATLKEHILDTLRYFHIFRHPLYVEDINKFLGVSVKRQELQEILSEMVDEKLLFCDRGMYSLENSEQIFIKRLVGAQMAESKMMEARRSAAIIANFPFVKGICISGSLSKGYADEKSDIDFFIITAEKRLWICRTMLHLFKKMTFLFNKQHSFCMNYFIDESRICLDEKNRFTATELSTLKPVYNINTYNQLVAGNREWVSEIFPNVNWSVECIAQVREMKGIKKVSETTLNILSPQKMNIFFMKLTDKLWRRKWKRKNYPMHEYDIAMKTCWYASKHHPLNYQKKVLKTLDH